MPSEIPPILDQDHLERATFGDRDLARDLLRLFEGQCLHLFPVIAGRSDDRARADGAHTLTGAARAIGAGRVAALAAAIEERGAGASAGDPALGALIHELRLAVEEARAAIAARLADDDDRPPLAKADGLA